MYFHAPLGVVLYFVVCKSYVNKKKTFTVHRFVGRVERLRLSLILVFAIIEPGLS